MRIAYCKDHLGNAAGMERVLSTKVNYLADNLGYEIHIITMSELPDNLFFNFSDKINFHSLEIEAEKKTPWNLIFSSKKHKIYKNKLAAILGQIKPDITVSMFGPEYNFLYQIKDGSKKVLEFHFSRNYLNHLVKGLPNAHYKIFKKIWVSMLQFHERYYTRKYQNIVLLTEKDKKLWGGKSKFTVIPNPLSFVSMHQASLVNKHIIAMGRYISQKGFDLLIRAYAKICQEFPDWKVFIIGEGQDKTYLQLLINNLSLQHKIYLKSPIIDVEKEMLESSIFVFPSRYEGFGLVLTEAMTCGVPCIAFDCECGPSEIIEDQEDGLLAETGNIEDLSSKMKLLIENETLRIKMGTLAKENVLRFDADKIMFLWDQYFKKIKTS